MSSIIVYSIYSHHRLAREQRKRYRRWNAEERRWDTEKFRGVIVREIEEIKSRLDGLDGKDLSASISFFREGIELLYEVFEKNQGHKWL